MLKLEIIVHLYVSKFVHEHRSIYKLLDSLGMQAYNRWGIVHKTHGVMADDEIWLRFEGETLTHKDVCLRKELYYPETTEESKHLPN